MGHRAGDTRAFKNVIGIDDGPFPRDAERCPLTAVVYAAARLDGLLTGTVGRDGDDATACISELIVTSRFQKHARAVLLSGITFGGFNVVDPHALSELLGKPVLVVARKAPDLVAIERALGHIRNGDQKWAIIERAGEMEPTAGVYVQRAGLTLEQARATVAFHAQHGALPEPLRVAHLLGAGIAFGHSHGSA